MMGQRDCFRVKGNSSSENDRYLLVSDQCGFPWITKGDVLTNVHAALLIVDGPCALFSFTVALGSATYFLKSFVS